MRFSGEELISVVVIVYNVKRYLKECIDSIINQSYQNLDIVLVDDGSTDGSSQLCDQFAKEDKRISVVHKENGGLVSARKMGIKAAKGEYIAFVDGDDWIDEDMYEKLYLFSKIFAADIVLSGIIREKPDEVKCDYNAVPNGYYDKENLEKNIYPDMMYAKDKCSPLIDPSLCNKLFKTELIRDTLLKVDSDIFYLGEDAATTFPCLLKAESVYVTDFCMYHHRIIIKNKSSVYKREKVYERLVLFYKNLTSNLKDSSYSEIMLPQVNGYFLHLLNSITKETINFDIMLFCRNLLFHKEETATPQMEMNMYKFPVGQFMKYKKIVLYGAGKVGQEYYRQITSLGSCIVLWADKRYKLLSNSGFPVRDIKDAKKLEYDVILLAAKQKVMADEMQNDLINAGFDKEKIVWAKPI